MRAYLATVLSVIAIGVLLVAWGLLAPRAAAAPYGIAAADAYTSPLARPVQAGDIVTLGPSADPYAAARQRLAYPVGDVRDLGPAPVRRASVSRVSSSGRNWQKTALVIGGTTAAGAGLGAIFGGGKGALIGAAIGGGASTLFEAAHR